MDRESKRTLEIGVLTTFIYIISTGVAGQTPTIRSKTELVEVNLVVRDKQGRAVTDLKVEDFEVFDNGKAQPIALFATERAEAPAPPLASSVFTNRTPISEGGGGYAVILLDWLNTGWLDRAQARSQVIRMLQQIQLDDRVALFVLDRGLRVVHDFSSDTASLLKKLEPVQSVPTEDQSTTSPWDASRSTFELDLFSTQPSGKPDAFKSLEEQVFAIDRRVEDTLAAFEYIAAHLSGIPGRKSLIWLSAGFPMLVDARVVRGASPAERTYAAQIDRAIRQLNGADVAVHAVDARGLPVGGRGYVDALQTFASRTGGSAFFNRNDLDTGIRRGLDDLRASYTLGYYMPEPPGKGFRRVQVRVRRRDVTLRYRTGYYWEGFSAGEGRDVQTTGLRAFSSPADTSAIPITVGAVRKGNVLELAIDIDSASIVLQSTRGRWRGTVDVATRFTREDGTQAAPVWSQAIQIDLSETGYKEAIQRGSVGFKAEVELPLNATKFRLLIRDVQRGVLGTVTIPLQQVREQQ